MYSLPNHKLDVKLHGFLRLCAHALLRRLARGRDHLDHGFVDHAVGHWHCEDASEI